MDFGILLCDWTLWPNYFSFATASEQASPYPLATKFFTAILLCQVIPHLGLIVEDPSEIIDIALLASFWCICLAVLKQSYTALRELLLWLSYLSSHISVPTGIWIVNYTWQEWFDLAGFISPPFWIQSCSSNGVLNSSIIQHPWGMGHIWIIGLISTCYGWYFSTNYEYEGHIKNLGSFWLTLCWKLFNEINPSWITVPSLQELFMPVKYVPSSCTRLHQGDQVFDYLTFLIWFFVR